MKEEWKKEWTCVLLVAAIAFLVYTNSLGNGFVEDDPGVILNNRAFHGTALSIFNAMDTVSDTQLLPFYRPFTYLTFYVERSLHNFNPFLMHLLNILLHAGNAFLVYRVARLLIEDQRAAMLAGLLFAVHPINSESVNYLSGGRNTMLACFFVLLAFLVHQKSISRGRMLYALAGALFFLAGLFSKELSMMLLPFIIAQEFLPLHAKGPEARSRRAMRLSPYFVAAICYLIMRWLALSKFGVQTGIVPGFGAQKLRHLYDVPGLQERIINNIYIIPKYLFTIVWPVALSPRYTVPDNFHSIVPALILAWACIIVALVWILRKRRSHATIFGLLWLLAFWLPVSGIVYFSDISMADRYAYLPAIGLWIMTADQAIRLTRSRVNGIRYPAIAILVLVAMAAFTIKRTPVWKNDVTLFSRMVEQYPENPYGHLSLGAAYLVNKDAQNLQIAEAHLGRAVQLDPLLPSVHTLLGYIHVMRGDFEGALYYLSEALRQSPLDREARINRGIVYEQMGRRKEALADYEFYLTIPGNNDLAGSQEYVEAKVVELRR